MGVAAALIKLPLQLIGCGVSKASVCFLPGAATSMMFFMPKAAQKRCDSLQIRCCASAYGKIFWPEANSVGWRGMFPGDSGLGFGLSAGSIGAVTVQSLRMRC